MAFRASFCDPLQPEIIELGDVEKDKVIELFESIPWQEHLAKMEGAGEVFYSPSLEVENRDNKNGLSVSAIDGSEWYIFFKRPKGTADDHVTDVQGQTEADVRECLQALLLNDLGFLERKFE